jgi:hypothetical protein
MRAIKLAGQQLQMPVARVFPESVEMPLGITLWYDENKERQTDEQRSGWHWLLSEWLRLDPGVAKNLEQLKTRVLIAKFGAAKVTDTHGNETLIPLRRTTQIWDWDRSGYRRKLLSRTLYIDLIDETYRLAAQDGIVLPILEPDVTKRERIRA